MSKPGKRMARRVLELYREIDPQIERQAQLLDTTCREGCAHCCRLMTLVSFPEAVAIVEYLLTQPLGEARLAHAVYRGMQMWQGFAHGRKHLDPGDYFKEQIPCVFLSNERCSIYEVRPATCRLHYVASPPEQCAGPETRVVGKIDVRKAEQWFVVRAVEASQRDGVGGAVAPLQVMLHYALAFHRGGLAEFQRAVENPPGPTSSLASWQEVLLRHLALLEEEARQP